MSRSICSNTTFTLSLTSSNPGTNFSWIPTVISGNVTGATSGSGTTINNFLVNTLSTSGTVQYTITPVSGGCVGNDTIYTVVVHPKPVVTTTPLTYSLCSPGLTAITLTSQVASPVFGWKATGSSGNVIGYSNGGGGIISQSLTNTGFNIENVIYRTAASANGCTGDSVNFTVTLKPMPNLSNVPLNKSQCNNQNTSVVLTSNVPGTLFTWTATPGSANITGQSDQLIPVALISQVLINSSYSDQIVTYHLTPHANGCTGVLVNFVVTVHPTPDLTNTPLNQRQCNSVNTNLLLTSHVTGTLFTWTTTPSSPNVTGYSNNIIPANQISQVLINIGNSVETVTYHITPFANGCTGTVSQFIVTVNPTPDLQVVPSTQTLCSGNQTNIQLQSGYTGTLFSWTATGSSPEVSGYSNGTGNKIQQILNNSGYLAPTVTYSITPSVSGCTGLQKQAIVTVKAIPIVTFQSCIDSVTTINARPFLLKRGIPIGGTYSGPGVNSLTGLFTPASAGTGLKTITYSYTNAAICSATGSLVIEVKTMVPFTCGNNLVDFRDNHSYPTVVIGTKCWMAVDLNHGAMVNSTQMQRDNCMVEKYCYNDDPANCSTLGGLYQWDEVMRYSDVSGDQGLCPSGWHIPSEVEWKTLFDAYISNGFAGSALKYSGFSGFNTLLTGIRFRNSVWKFPSTDLILKSKLYWSSTTNGAFKAWAHGMNEVVDAPDFTPSVSFYPALRSNALAARCVRD
ncbi:MAG: PKD-like domain-containing protein [Bacteroidota bacterium]